MLQSIGCFQTFRFCWNLVINQIGISPLLNSNPCWKISCVESSHLNIKDNHGSLILDQKRFEGKLYFWRFITRTSPSEVFVSSKIGQHPKADFVSKIPCESNHATISDELNLAFLPLAPNILTLHHFFLGRMYLKIVFAKQDPFCWAFVLSEILIKDHGQKHTSYFHIPRRDGHAHWPDCQSLQDGRLRGREDLRTSGEVHL